MSDDKPTVPHVSEQQFVATCEQCGAKARGSFRDLIDGGWTVMPAGQVKETPCWFCPGCVTGLAPA